ncbi:ammonia-forming cytochrome c nitrite reductase subunit c552 [Halobacteriovorax sp. DPLXC-1]|uniref:ammonia-forming cytochrome c nitrite reductase subunit c552 n=1 Tax=Halobacteriovorax sp. DPLXC-1 TaxID=3110771 RepID=UPI002FEEFCCF
MTTSCFRSEIEVVPFDANTRSLTALSNDNDPSQCLECHKKEVDQWKSSDHFHSMKLASKNNVLANFSNAKFQARKTNYRFFTNDENFFVEIDGQKYPIIYTFGYMPLQQYVIQLQNGHFQILPIAWDVKQKKWYDTLVHLSSAQHDSLHWSMREHNWNNRCASCHSTGLIKNYDLNNHAYDTKSITTNISCFSCHGDANLHLKWARLKDADLDVKNKGFFEDADKGFKTMVAPNGHHAPNLISNDDINSKCLSCHSLREDMTSNANYTNDYLNQFSPRIVSEQHYQLDGQQDEEAFVGGSFMQSKMFHKGVKCINCHSPHTGKLKSQGNSLCLQCHTQNYAEISHTQHKNDDITCMNCHMPKKTYMGIDMRADHQFVIPRPDYSLKYGVSNSCTNCHSDKSRQEMNEMFQAKYPKLKTRHRLLEIIGENRLGNLSSKQAFLDYINDKTIPEMRRAQAVSYLREYPSMKQQDYEKLLDSKSILVRKATLELIAEFPDLSRLEKSIMELAKSSIKSLSYPATYILVMHGLNLTLEENKEIKLNLKEYINHLIRHSDSPENLLRLANLSRFGHFSRSPAELLNGAIRKYPNFIGAYINLADMSRASGNENLSHGYLMSALQNSPESAPVHAALGMSFTRAQNYQKALEFFNKASVYEKNNPYYSYLYILTLKSIQGSEKAIIAAEKRLKRFRDSFLFNQLVFSLSVELQDVERVKKYTPIINKFRN